MQPFHLIFYSMYLLLQDAEKVGLFPEKIYTPNWCHFFVLAGAPAPYM